MDHIMVVKNKDKLILEHGWERAEVYRMSDNLCLTKPWTTSSLSKSNGGGWCIWDLKNKELIVDFRERKDALEYFSLIIKEKVRRGVR